MTNYQLSNYSLLFGQKARWLGKMIFFSKRKNLVQQKRGHKAGSQTTSPIMASWRFLITSLTKASLTIPSCHTNPRFKLPSAPVNALTANALPLTKTLRVNIAFPAFHPSFPSGEEIKLGDDCSKPRLEISKLLLCSVPILERRNFRISGMPVNGGCGEARKVVMAAFVARACGQMDEVGG